MIAITMSEADEPFLPMSDLERRFEQWRARVGFVLAPLVFAAVLMTRFETLKPEAHRLAAVMAAVVVLWVTEVLPMPITALLGAAACVVLRVAEAKAVFAPFADQLMFLFIGSFILGAGHISASPRSPAGVRSDVAGLGGCSARANPVRFRSGHGLHFRLDFEHRHDRHDDGDRPLDHSFSF